MSITRAAVDSDSDVLDSQDQATCDRIVDAQEQLEGHGPVVSFGPSEITLRVALDAELPTYAIEEAQALTEKALKSAGLPIWPVIAVEAMEWEAFERSLDVPNIPAVIGVTELADMLGVSRQRASELARVDRFPKPFVELASGPVWLEPNVKDFVATWERRPGRPRKP